MTIEGRYFRNIEDDYINALPPGGFAGTIHVIEGKEQFTVVQSLLTGQKVLGFDTETRPTFKRGQFHNVALLQLATNEHAFLFRLNRVKLPGFVRDILQNESILKIGVALRDDLTGLKKLSHMEPAGFIDLQQYVKGFGIEDNGLKKLVANVLGFRISKRFQTSNWEQETLSMEQLAYASTDAWVCLKIYEELTQWLPA